MPKHAESCSLYSVHWLRHAVAAAGRIVNEAEHQHADRKSAQSLTDTLSHFAELPNWETVTLLDIAEHATLMATPENERRFSSMCTCGQSAT